MLSKMRQKITIKKLNTQKIGIFFEKLEKIGKIGIFPENRKKNRNA